MANLELKKSLEKSAVKVKKVILALKKASKKAGMEDKYGPNGPMGELAIDLVFPNMSSEVFEDLLSSDEKVMKLREVYRFTLSKQGADMLATSKMDSLDRYIGAKNCAETFEKFANAYEDVKGNKKTVEKILDIAQDTKLLKSKIKKADEEERAPRENKEIADKIGSSPTNDDTAAIKNTLDNFGMNSLEDFAKTKNKPEKGEE